ncbi:MAG: hypothetical protein ACTHJH_12660 [Marmoricola sp.]
MTTGPEHDERAPQVAEALADLAAHTGVAADPALAARLDALAARGRGLAPEPSGDLAALLAGRRAAGLDTPVLRVPGGARAGRRRRAALAAGGLVIALAAGTGAAAADVLPDPVQRVVARFSEHFLPFDLPAPAPTAPGTPAPADPAATPTPARPSPPTTPEGRSTATPAPAPPGATRHPEPSPHASRPGSPTPGAPTALPGHRSGAAPTTAPTPGQRGRSQALPTTPAREGRSAGPVRPGAGTPRPARPSASRGAQDATGSHRAGGRSVRPTATGTLPGRVATAVPGTARGAGSATGE